MVQVYASLWFHYVNLWYQLQFAETGGGPTSHIPALESPTLAATFRS